MGESTKIQWADHTFNPWRGCTKVAPGCANCYADAQSKRNPKTLGIWGPNGTRVVASEAMWREPLKWEREAACKCDASGHCDPCLNGMPRVFCASLADVFEDWDGVPVNSRGQTLWRSGGKVAPFDDDCMRGESPIPASLDDVRARLFRLIDATPSLDWLLLTKRPQNVRRMWPEYELGRWDSTGRELPRKHGRRNVWLGTSIACQEDADRNIPELLACRGLASRLFVSIEPLIGPVDLTQVIANDGDSLDVLGGYGRAIGGASGPFAPLDWVIVGGESGPNARPCDIAWIRSIVRQCRDAEVPVFVKQLGAYCLDNDARSRRAWPLAVPMTLRDDCTRMIYRDPKGGDPAEWPEDVRVREVPDVKGGAA